ncbi:sulfite exporter TauE/SafE family protein [Pseudoroseicyclus aestuarii]|uniref:Probable membrane transporter protein n=1 Tax=Pseudoroseicyclus aestuarii TaxID=1795041 RepID=A0A318SYK8_9RHOB|nr:sulfite exporter TauE/SafE family protein [Pseudoroseicyclus aestuarii]PYE85446.1 hypothetical protein DFP88_101111 [Pseudoroseicyclus aestuarii]
MGAGLAQALALPGFPWLLAATLLAGTVYGFAGFGAALVFLPIATVFLPPQTAVAAFNLAALSSLVAVVPKAWPQADRRAVGWMLLGALLSGSAGILVLRRAAPEAIGWAVSILVLLTLAALMLGWRHSLAARPRNQLAIGMGTGLVGGATGLTGPVMVLFQLSGGDSVARSRANSAVFLTLTSLMFLPLFILQGLMTAQAVSLGLLLVLPYALGCWLGTALFRPALVPLYRGAAYSLIGTAVLAGLPLWH